MTSEQMKRFEEQVAKLKPGQQAKISVDEGHAVLVMVTNESGINSGRPRYLVACVTCEALLHEATTGPLQMVQRHVSYSAGLGDWKRRTV